MKLEGNFKVKSCRYDILHVDLGNVDFSRKYIEIFPRDGRFKFLKWENYGVILSDGRNSIRITKYNHDVFYEILQFCVNHDIKTVEVFRKDGE